MEPVERLSLSTGSPFRWGSACSMPNWGIMEHQSDLDRLRQLCLALPEVEERLSHGAPTWFVRGKKTFVTYATGHHDARAGFWCAAPPGAQEAYVTNYPERYFRPPYVGHRGWLGVYLDSDPDWGEIAVHVEDAFLVVAPKRLTEALALRHREETSER